MIRECDDSWLADHYGGGWGGLARGALCGDEVHAPEAFFDQMFRSAIHRISMLEPSFAVLSPEATCSLFNSCDPGIESELRNRVAKSGISGAFNDILRLTSDTFDIFTSLYFQSPLFNETCDHLSRRAKPGEKTVAVRALLEPTSTLCAAESQAHILRHHNLTFFRIIYRVLHNILSNKSHSKY